MWLELETLATLASLDEMPFGKRYIYNMNIGGKVSCAKYLLMLNMNSKKKSVATEKNVAWLKSLDWVFLFAYFPVSIIQFSAHVLVAFSI